MPDDEIKSAHNHPLDGTVVVLHFQPRHRGNILNTPMHAFGPFYDEAAAILWHAVVLSEDDDCVKLIIDLFDPYPKANGGTQN